MFSKAAAGAANRASRGSAEAHPAPAPQPGAGTGRDRWASCRWRAWRRRSTRPATARSALVTVAGNPVLSTPNAWLAALATLDFYVAVDPYINETTHADVILPVPTALQKGHYDLALLQLALRNVANYSPPVLPLEEGQLDEWKVLARLALVLQGMGDRRSGDRGRPRGAVAGGRGGGRRDQAHRRSRHAEEIIALLGEHGPERLIDLMLRTGPYGDGFGANPGGLSLDVLLDQPTAWTSARWSPGCRAAHALGHGGAGARAHRRTSPDCGPRSTPPPTA